MDNDIYQAPSSNLEKPEPAVGSSLKGILYGALISFAGSFAAGLTLGIGYAIILSNAGVPAEEIESRLDNLSFTSMPGIVLIAMIIPFVFLGGYICAKKSIDHIYRNVTIMCLIGIVIGYLIDDGSQYTLADQIVAYAASIVPAYIGAYFWKQKSS